MTGAPSDDSPSTRPIFKRKTREAFRLRVLRVTGLLQNGWSAEEVAALEGMGRRRLNDLLARAGVAAVHTPPGMRRVTVRIGGGRAAWLDRIARDLDTSPAEALAVIVARLFRDGDAAARRLIAGELATVARRRKREARKKSKTSPTG